MPGNEARGPSFRAYELHVMLPLQLHRACFTSSDLVPPPIPWIYFRTPALPTASKSYNPKVTRPARRTWNSPRSRRHLVAGISGLGPSAARGEPRGLGGWPSVPRGGGAQAEVPRQGIVCPNAVSGGLGNHSSWVHFPGGLVELSARDQWRFYNNLLPLCVN